MLRTTQRAEWSQKEIEEVLKMRDDGFTNKEISEYFTEKYRKISALGIQSFFSRYKANGNKLNSKRKASPVFDAVSAQPFYGELMAKHYNGVPCKDLVIWVNDVCNYKITYPVLYSLLNHRKFTHNWKKKNQERLSKNFELIKDILLREGIKFKLVNHSNLINFFRDIPKISPSEKDIDDALKSLVEEGQCVWINDKVLSFK